MPPDHVNTDAIYGKDYTYRDDVTPRDDGARVMENYDPKSPGALTPAMSSLAD
jgi:hypothetical protein